jgi:hypothetical protein
VSALVAPRKRDFKRVSNAQRSVNPLPELSSAPIPGCSLGWD